MGRGVTSTAAGHEECDTPAAETDVLIVGAGPVGCALAVDLRLRGVRCAIVERDEGISYDMRAMNNSMRTMEHMRGWGIAERIRRCSRVPPEFRHDLVFATALHGHELGVFRAYGFRPEDARELACEPGAPMSQKHTARVLRSRAQELGCRVHTGWEFVEFEQSPERVTVRVSPTGSRGASNAVSASYLVGCDGGRSSVRACAGIAMTGVGALGKHIHAVIGCRALLEDLAVSAGCFYVVFNPQVGGLVLPSDVDEFNLHLAGYDPDQEISVEELATKARQVIGRDVEIEVKRSSPYLIHELTAESYRDGRVLIAGDACHLFCPFGGFNMNTGIDDAANLGWKLAAILAGWGGEQLLDSYTEERRPIALANCAAASANVHALVASIAGVLRAGVPDGEGARDDAARRRLGRRLYDETYSEWNTHGIVLDQRYTSSSVIVDDGSSAPAWEGTSYLPLAKPGHRLPHSWLAEDVSIYDRVGPGLTLLDCGAQQPEIDALRSAASSRAVPLEVLRIADPAIAARYEAPLVLARPDQHVAWRGTHPPARAEQLIDVLRGAGGGGRDAPSGNQAALGADRGRAMSRR
jgi:2-polyprenyl-6-methoxyphenol hydroxylase-like FAD-dependent oxidoreductase